MKALLFTSVILIATMVGGCVFPTGIIHGSDDTTIVSKSSSGFTKVAVSNACEAVITRAETFSVKIEVNENVEEYLNVNMENGSLNISLDNCRSYLHLTFKATITMPELEKVSCSDASKMTFSGFSSENPFSAVVSDASKLNGSLNSGDISLNVSDASEVSLTGVGENLTCTVSDASKLKLKEMKCNNAAITVSDASNVDVNVTGNLTGKVTDASKVTYYGNVVKGTLTVKDGSKVVRGD
jgi:hypothetical protein